MILVYLHPPRLLLLVYLLDGNIRILDGQHSVRSMAGAGQLTILAGFLT